MAKLRKEYAQNETTNLLEKLNIVLYLCGLRDFWIEGVRLPHTFVKCYNSISRFVEIFMFVFMALEVGAFVTQTNLTDKQVADRLVFGISHPILYIYCLNLILYKDIVRDVLYHLAVVLKKHNDKVVEQEMIKKLKFYLTAFVTSCGLCIVFYGVSGYIQFLRTDAPFTTVITAWPDVEDKSNLAHVSRVIFYFFWWIYFGRVSGSYVLILSMFICLSFQYRHLQCYFNSLNKIFDNDPAKQRVMETEFELAFKTGIKLHSDTLWCAQQCQDIYRIIFSAQMLMTIAELVSVMSQMMSSERTLVNMGAIVSTTCGTLISTGFLMWNAGDVTVEASNLPSAMYNSGWHNCYRQSSRRTRKLVVMAMSQAQKPVVFLALGYIEVSYETYLAIVKSSYSVFSVLY